ncbi:MAG: magnesium transporter CorA family protein [bacterium]|nr:magnesium transporter CorA family protein [bacterium]
MLKQYNILDGKLVENQRDGQVLVYVNPDENERRFLLENYKLDEHTLNSSLDPDELSRMEFEPEHLALIYKRPKNYSSADQFLFRVTSSGLFLFKDRLILVLSEEIPIFEGKYFTRINSLQNLMLKLIYRSIFHFLEHLRIINSISDSLEQKISTSMENRYLLNLFILEKSLVYYLNAINSNSMLIEKLKYNSIKIGFSADEMEFLDDIIIENNQCYKQAEIYSNILAGMMDARASIVSNNLNVLMKTLNIITIGIMVPTLVVSAFSMNVKIPVQNHPDAFWIIMGFATVSVGLFYALWRYKKW